MGGPEGLFREVGRAKRTRERILVTLLGLVWRVGVLARWMVSSIRGDSRGGRHA